MEKDFKPTGALSMIITDRKYIKFFPPNDFDKSFGDLLAEIESIHEAQNRTTNSE